VIDGAGGLDHRQGAVRFVREAGRGAASEEVACDGDVAPGQALTSGLELEAVAGQSYYIFVDGYNGSGDYTVTITQGPFP
jgi:hypothetical protein